MVENFIKENSSIGECERAVLQDLKKYQRSMGRLLTASTDVNAMVTQRNKIRGEAQAKYVRMCQYIESRYSNGIVRGIPGDDVKLKEFQAWKAKHDDIFKNEEAAFQIPFANCNNNVPNAPEALKKHIELEN